MSTTERDVPRKIAFWLFIFGTIWTVWLIPFVVVSFVGIFQIHEKNYWLSWTMLATFLPGYAVWLGWFWRSRRNLSIRIVTFLWVVSIADNLYFIVPFFKDGDLNPFLL
jgi:hypothetical protein